MRFTALCITLAFCLAANQMHAQGTPKTLLWKISGNSFSKPCYLYGTMHTGDKRVYYIGDSVYSGIALCDGFAMEIDPGENVDTFINSIEARQLDIAYREAIENNQVKKDPNFYKRKQWELDSAYNALKQRYNDLSSRDIARLRRAYRQRDRNEMNTTFDLYLFDLAKTQGKIVGGLEDISGRSKLLDELGNTFDPDVFLKSQRKKYVDVFEWLITNYIKADLDEMHAFSKNGATEKYLSTMLYNRNHIMCKRIDSLGKLRSTFYAVGAAHLPGDSGIISLLRNKGFTVEPVFSSKKIEPGDYKIDRKITALINVSDQDSNYIVKMPGKPTDVMGLTNRLYVRVYKELSNEIMLMCGVYEDGDVTNTLDKEVAEMKRYFSWTDAKIINTQKINRQNLDGHEFFLKGQKGYLKLHLFHKDGKTYVFGAGAKTKDSIEASRSRSYLDSYQMILDRPAGESETVSFVSAGKAFAVKLPARPKVENISGTITDTKQDITLFSSIDLKKKISYLVMVKEPFKGYYNDFDSSIFTETTSEVLKGLFILNTAEENILLDNQPALKTKVLAEADGKTTVVYSIQALRNNRFYNITIRGLANAGYELQFDKFINSFQFLPYLETRTDPQVSPGNVFTVTAASPIGILKNKIAAAKNRTDYYAFDSSKAMSYGVTALPLGKYYWTDSKNSLLNEYTRIHFNDSLAVNNISGSDSLLYKKTVFNGSFEGREIFLKTIYNNSYSRIRLMHYADSVFVLNIKGDYNLVTNNAADIFFSSFRFNNNNFTSTAFNSKTDLFLKDIQSADSLRSKAAADALSGGIRFPEQDLPKVLDAFLYDYSRINSNGHDVPSLLSKALAAYPGDVLLNFIQKNYPLVKEKREDLRLLMINLLSATNNSQSYQVLKDFLLNSPPVAADYTVALNNAGRYPQMAATLFPGLAIKIKDEHLAAFVLSLANMLIDSNKIQYNIFKEYEDDMIRSAKKILGKYRDNNNENYQIPHTATVLQMLVKMNQKQSRSVLSDFQELQNYNLTSMIIMAYVKNNQAPPAGLLDWFCTEPERRILLYDDLVKAGRQSFFTGQYASQNAFAEAFSMIYTNNEVGETAQKFYDLVAVKDATIKNNAGRFYIYKITCLLRRGTVIYTGIIGPFSPNPSNYSIKEGKELYILYKKPFDTNLVDGLFDDFIQQVKKMNQ